MDAETKDILLAKALAGEASATEQAALEAWLASEPGARTEWEEMQRLWTGADELLATTPRFNAGAAWDKVSAQTVKATPHKALKIPLSTAPRARRITLPKWWRYAAMAAVLLVSILLMKPAQGEKMLITVGKYDRHTVALADGSQVVLRKGTRLKHPRQFSGNNRRVSLDGEAFFEVTRDHERPFIINTDAAFVTVLGTSFNVQSGKAQTVVTVATGKVEVMGKPSESVVLAPGQRGTVGGGQVKKELALGGNHLFWKTGVLEYNAVPLTDVVAEMSRLLSPNNIMLDNSLTTVQRTQAVTIRFGGQPVEEMLSELCTITGLRLQKQGETAYFITGK